MTSMHNHSNETYQNLFTISGTSVASILIIVTCLANILLLLILYRAKSTREIKNDCYGYYLINLCITNILAAIVCIITSITYANMSCDSFSSLLQILCALQIISSSICIETVALMTMERYHVAQNPIRKRKTLSRVKQKIYIIWLWAFINASPQLFLHRYVDIEAYLHQCTLKHYWIVYIKLYAFFLMFSIVIIPSAIILFCSIGVLLAYSTESALSLKRRKRYRRFVYFVLVLWMAYMLTNFPKYLLEISLSMNIRYRKDISEWIFSIFLILSWCNYLLIPAIYIGFYGRIIKHELWKMYDKNENCRLSHIYQVLHSPIFSSRSSSINDIETYLIRRPLLHVDEIDGHVMQHINFELYNDEVNSNRNSAVHDGKHSIFRKRLLTADKHVLDENQFLSALVPNVDHVINKLNQKDVRKSVRK